MSEKKEKSLLEHSLSCAKDGNLKQAISCLESAIKLNPDLPVNSYMTLGNAFLEEGMLKKAELLFENLKDKYPHHSAGYVGLAKISYKKKDWQSCQRLWQTCFDRFPEKTRPIWYLQYASSLLKLGEYQKAASIYEQCTIAYPLNKNGFIEKAKAAQLNGLWQEAVDYWQQCIKRFPDDIKPQWINQKKQALLKLGDFKALQQEALYQLEPDSESIYNKIQMNKFEPSRSSELNFHHILIVTYGRSGSTLLQGLINAIDGVVIRGENDNVFYDLYKSYQKLLELKSKHKNTFLPHQAWYGAAFHDELNLISGYQHLARKILVEDQFGQNKKLILGFKEIRYNEVGDDLEPYLDFLQEIFPNAAFIFNTRNVNDVAKSAWWRDMEHQQVVKELLELEKRFQKYSISNNNCFSITYEDVISKNSNFKSMYAFLGADYDENIIDAVLQTPHSYNPQ